MAQLEPLVGQPHTDGALVFDAPWQARTFAMAVMLHESGWFSWQEWATLLARHIAAFEKHANIADNDAYYQLWQQTLEQLVAEKIARQSE